MDLGIYKDVQLLNREVDRELKVGEIQGFSYATDLRDCIVTTSEFFEAAKSQPIVFAKNRESGEFFAVAILGLKAEKNLFIEEDGNWREGEYVPAFIRRYPFIFAKQDESGNVVLALDRGHEAVGQESGQPLFDEKGTPTPYTDKVLSFMETYQNSNAQTQALVKVLDEMALLEDANAQIQKGDEKFTFTGFMRVSEERLNALSDENLLKLVRSGAYKWIVAHLMSLSNFNKLLTLSTE